MTLVPLKTIWVTYRKNTAQVFFIQVKFLNKRTEKKKLLDILKNELHATVQRLKDPAITLMTEYFLALVPHASYIGIRYFLKSYFNAAAILQDIINLLILKGFTKHISIILLELYNYIQLHQVVLNFHQLCQLQISQLKKRENKIRDRSANYDILI